MVSLFMPPWPSNTTEEVFARMPAVDSMLHEGGGGPLLATAAGTARRIGAETAEVGSVLNSLGELAAALRRHHPAATVWMSPGGETTAWMDAWYTALASPSISSWLTGVSWGPVILGSQTEMLARLSSPVTSTTNTNTTGGGGGGGGRGESSGYKLRLYPDVSAQTESVFANNALALCFRYGNMLSSSSNTPAVRSATR